MKNMVKTMLSTLANQVPAFSDFICRKSGFRMFLKHSIMLCIFDVKEKNVVFQNENTDLISINV